MPLYNTSGDMNSSFSVSTENICPSSEQFLTTPTEQYAKSLTSGQRSIGVTATTSSNDIAGQTQVNHDLTGDIVMPGDSDTNTDERVRCWLQSGVTSTSADDPEESMSIKS